MNSLSAGKSAAGSVIAFDRTLVILRNVVDDVAGFDIDAVDCDFARLDPSGLTFRSVASAVWKSMLPLRLPPVDLRRVKDGDVGDRGLARSCRPLRR